MDSQKIKQLLIKKEVQDYTYFILFFLVFSFFAFFVIKPVLSVGVRLRREASDLKKINETFDANIRQVIRIQTQLETIRDEKYLIDEAIPKSPSTGSVVSQIESASAQSGTIITKLTINEIIYKSKEATSTGLQGGVFDIEVKGEFNQIMNFLTLMSSQRRLKTITKMKVETVSSATGEAPSGILVMTISIAAHYI